MRKSAYSLLSLSSLRCWRECRPLLNRKVQSIYQFGWPNIPLTIFGQLKVLPTIEVFVYFCCLLGDCICTKTCKNCVSSQQNTVLSSNSEMKCFGRVDLSCTSFIILCQETGRYPLNEFVCGLPFTSVVQQSAFESIIGSLKSTPWRPRIGSQKTSNSGVA